MHILIADDHILFRDTLHQYIQRAQPGYTIHTASNLPEVTNFLKSAKFIPDLCIIDYKMPGMKGCQSFADLVQNYPRYSFAVMSGVAEQSDIKKILELGVSGFLPKTLPGRVILKAIDTMLEGKKYIPYEKDGETPVPSYFGTPSPTVSSSSATEGDSWQLTGREKEVLALLCQGKTNKDIADELNLKTVTVKLHMRGIFRKLDCDNRTKVVLKARELGLIN